MWNIFEQQYSDDLLTCSDMGGRNIYYAIPENWPRTNFDFRTNQIYSTNYNYRKQIWKHVTILGSISKPHFWFQKIKFCY